MVDPKKLSRSKGKKEERAACLPSENKKKSRGIKKIGAPLSANVEKKRK
jgi:hypothetical protein